VIVTDTFGATVYGGRGGIEDCSFYGPPGMSNSYNNQAGGIYLGASDGTTGGSGTATVSGCTATGSGFKTSWPAWQPIIINGVTQLIASVAIPVLLRSYRQDRAETAMRPAGHGMSLAAHRLPSPLAASLAPTWSSTVFAYGGLGWACS
jgi:hypothetical protein